MSSSNVLIVGGGLAAQRAAETLRARGFDGAVRILCGEPVAPYDRPPLSKELRGAPFRDASWYRDQSVSLTLGARAAGLDLRARRVLLDDGSSAGWDDLIIATGARPRRLPIFGPDVLELRTVADAERLRGVLVPGARLAIVGAGFVGQEVAATARSLGVDVTLIEAAEAPLVGVLGPRLGGWFATLHRDEGVRVELGVSVASVGHGSLLLSDGRTVAADAVLVAVGVAPDTRWLAGTPLAELGGVRTVVPRVYAAGDVVRGCHHWEPAARMGAAAARAILGLEAAPEPASSFWSDMYGVRIHLVGDAAGADAVSVDGDGRDFTAVFHRHGVEIGALLVGRPRELPSWRRRLSQPLETRSAA